MSYRQHRESGVNTSNPSALAAAWNEAFQFDVSSLWNAGAPEVGTRDRFCSAIRIVNGTIYSKYDMNVIDIDNHGDVLDMIKLLLEHLLACVYLHFLSNQ